MTTTIDKHKDNDLIWGKEDDDPAGDIWDCGENKHPKLIDD